MLSRAAADTFAIVAALVRETQSLAETRPILPQHLLFYDLSFSSMDLLDLMFRVEDRFGIVINEAVITRLARGDLGAAAFAADGVLTAAGRARLMTLLADTPASLFPERIDTATLPRFCTVGALGRMVDLLLAEKLAAACSN